MSGVKYSTFEIQKEVKERQSCISKLNELKGNINSIRENINKLLTTVTEGVKKSFSSDIEYVQRLMKDKLIDFNENMTSSQLKNIISEYEKIKEKIENALSMLVEIIEVKKDKRAKELIKRFEILKSEISGLTSLFTKWKNEEYENIKKGYEVILSLLNKEDFLDSEKKLNDLETYTNNLKHEIYVLEEKDNQRQYVFAALRKVCKEMGWEEIEIKNQEHPKDPIIFKVNTFSSGTITFYLSLDLIKVDSCISKDDGTCIKEFNNVSEKLKKFGVGTKFQIEGEDSEPKLIQKGEIDIPDSDFEKEMEA